MQIKVVENAKRNIIFGFINKFIFLICPFIERTVLQRLLGAQYLGLNSLFASILSVLGLAELGFGNALVYNMYQPAAQGNVRKVHALLCFYRKAYRLIGLVIIFAYRESILIVHQRDDVQSTVNSATRLLLLACQLSLLARTGNYYLAGAPSVWPACSSRL